MYQNLLEKICLMKYFIFGLGYDRYMYMINATTIPTCSALKDENSTRRMKFHNDNNITVKWNKGQNNSNYLIKKINMNADYWMDKKCVEQLTGSK